MVREDCFAYVDTSFNVEDEYTVKQIACKALTELVCKKKHCPFYKKKGTENEVIFHAQGTKDTK